MTRLAKKDDREELITLFMELHRHHVEIKPETFRMPEREWFSQRISEILDDDELKVFVHDNGCGIDSYAVVKIIDIITEEKFPRKVCYIDCFAVSENCRRKGIGTELFSAIKNTELKTAAQAFSSEFRRVIAAQSHFMKNKVFRRGQYKWSFGFKLQ